MPPTPFLLGLWIRVHLLQAGVGSFSRASALRSGGMWAAILLAADCSGISLETLSLAETWRGEGEASLWSQAQLSLTKFHQERSPEGGPMGQRHLLIWSFREKGRASVIGPSERDASCLQTYSAVKLTFCSWGSEERCRPPLGILLQFSVLEVQDLDSWRRETTCDLESEKFHSGR